MTSAQGSKLAKAVQRLGIERARRPDTAPPAADGPPDPSLHPSPHPSPRDGRRGALSLRAVFAMATSMFVMLALVAAVALIALTTLLRRSSDSIGAAVESVRLAEEAELDLLLHDRPGDALVKRDIEARLQRRLRDAAAFVTTDDERAVLNEANLQTRAYFAAAAATHEVDGLNAAERSRALDARAQAMAEAYRALEALVTVNVEQAREARRDAERWNRIGNGIGVGAAVAVLVIGIALLAWLFGRAFRPVLALAQTMDRFGRGDRDARADERGTSELLLMSHRFNEMATAISRQRASQSAFLGSIAHDLKNPLSALRMTLSFTDSDAPLPPPDKVRNILMRVSRQIARMDRMIGDLLELSAIDAGKLQLVRAAHDARRIVEDVVDLFRGEASQGHTFDVRVPDHAVAVLCDDARIEQVLTNLVSNAIKYSPPGTVIEMRVEVTGESEREVERQRVRIIVADSGRGIAADDLDRIFEPFRRLGVGVNVHNSSARAAGDAPSGTGLGLFAARRLVESQGGTLTVTSRLGEGSMFVVDLPAALNTELDDARR